MSPTSYQLLYPAVLDCKDKHKFYISKDFYKIFAFAFPGETIMKTIAAIVSTIPMITLAVMASVV